MHVIPELKKLERAYPNQFVVIGVHSAKFEAEQDSHNITAAVARYEIEHPVVNDAHLEIWKRYGISSWPTLVLIDPEGYVLDMHGGEIKADVIDGFLKSAIPFYRQKGLLDEKPLRLNADRGSAADTPLRFPGKILADEPTDRLFIADSNHNRIVVTHLDGKLLETIGSGAAGAADGNFGTAQFNHPQGMALRGNMLYVADTENHLLRKVDLAAHRVTTIAGTGHQSDNSWPGVDPEAAQGGPTGTRPRYPERFIGRPLKTAARAIPLGPGDRREQPFYRHAGDAPNLANAAG